MEERWEMKKMNCCHWLMPNNFRERKLLGIVFRDRNK